MKTAIIGLGTIGSAVAKNLTRGGVDVIVAQRDSGGAERLAQQLGDRATALPIPEALKAADIIILAIWFDAIKQFLADNAAVLSGKIIVDPSNPIAPDGKGGFTKTIPEHQSAGEMLAKLLPPGAKLVKAFGTLSGASLASAGNRQPERAVLFYAADDPSAGAEVARLIEASGFDAVSVGGLDQSIRIEVFGELHEFGKLGKLVSKKEASVLLGEPKPAVAAL